MEVKRERERGGGSEEERERERVCIQFCKTDQPYD